MRRRLAPRSRSALGKHLHPVSPRPAQHTVSSIVRISLKANSHSSCVSCRACRSYPALAYRPCLREACRTANSNHPSPHDFPAATATMYQNESMKLKDGRTLSYAIYGSPVHCKTIIYMHGFPSSRYEGKLWHSACAKHNIRLIAPDRPGNGLSTFQAKRRILDWPADILALAEYLKIDQFYILAVSGGAPYALACVKAIARERLLGASIVSGLYPVKFGTGGMLFPNRVLYWVAPWMTGLATTFFDAKMGKASRDENPKIFEDLLSNDVDGKLPADRDAIKDPTNWCAYVAMTRESFHLGSEGASWEARLYGCDWGFELVHMYVGDDAVPLTLWHGTEDANCPVAMAKKAKELMPGSMLRLKEGGGHVSFVFRDVDDILEHLIGQEEKEEYMTVNS